MPGFIKFIHDTSRKTGYNITLSLERRDDNKEYSIKVILEESGIDTNTNSGISRQFLYWWQ